MTSTSALTLEKSEVRALLAADPRWQLVQRVISSPGFLRSPKLVLFLKFICRLALTDQADQISEQRIGEKVFDRDPNYDASSDSIVRAHAVRLRAKLEDYFLNEGIAEPLHLSIPRGGYLPVFRSAGASLEPESFVQPLSPVERAFDTEASAFAAKNRFLLLSVGVLSLLLVGTATYCLYLYRLHAKRIQQEQQSTSNPLLNRIFRPDSRTIAVTGDSGLVMYQRAVSRQITLSEYLNGSYVREHEFGTNTFSLDDLATRRYTSIVDLNTTAKLAATEKPRSSTLELKFARDIRPNDLKDTNVILIGAHESNPWVELFADKMNFSFEKDAGGRSFVIVNRSPQAGEQARLMRKDGDPKIYGLLAFVTGLNGKGEVLILEGTSQAGTESVSDLLFDGKRLQDLLRKVQQPNGTIPHFEMLLESDNAGGSASQVIIKAIHWHP